MVDSFTHTLVPFSAMSKKPAEDPSMQTTVRIKQSTWRALRALSEARALEVGGRPSASAVVEELVEAAARRRGRKGAARA